MYISCVYMTLAVLFNFTHIQEYLTINFSNYVVHYELVILYHNYTTIHYTLIVV